MEFINLILVSLNKAKSEELAEEQKQLRKELNHLMQDEENES